MKFFLDTANLNEIREAAATGILDGITTNPTLISKEGNAFEDQLLKICEIVDGPISAETISLETDFWQRLIQSIAITSRSLQVLGLGTSVAICSFRLIGRKYEKVDQPFSAASQNSLVHRCHPYSHVRSRNWRIANRERKLASTRGLTVTCLRKGRSTAN